MKVAQLLLSHGNGGLEKHVRELAVELFKAGNEVAVIGHPQFLADLPDGISRYPVATGLSRLNPFLHLAILRALRQFQPLLVHAQANKAASVLSHLQRFLPAATVGTLHNIKRDTRAFHRLNHVITVSQQLAVPFASGSHSVIYNGIANAVVPPCDLYRQFQLPADKPVFIAAGRLVSAKGFDMLLDAVDGLPLSLLLVGDGPAHDRLSSRISQMASTTEVRLLGHRTDLATLMAAADGVLISSRREGFSYVFSEALMLGCRILSTDVPVANEVLPAELLVAVDDAPDFRQKLADLLALPDRWSALMSAPRHQAVNAMSLEAMRDKTLATYHAILARKPC
jgi:glycosyltransferase involved in cell wall biosynthesis